MKRLVLILACCSVLATAAAAQEKQPPPVRKLVKVEHVNAQEVGNLLQWIRYYPSRELSTIILEGSPEDVAKAEEIIHAVDTPRAGFAGYEGAVEIDAYFVAAGANAAGEPVPPLVAPVVAELQKRFSYAAYGLLDSTLVRASVRSGVASVQGQFARTDDGPISYKFGVNPSDVSEANGARSVRINSLHAEWNIPYREQVTNFETGQTSTQTMTRSLRIDTNVSLPEGKLVVVGKAGSPTSAEAIFLVIRVRLVE
jgi:hypothetical protein